jgi:hypothetical protein
VLSFRTQLIFRHQKSRNPAMIRCGELGAGGKALEEVLDS